MAELTPSAPPRGGLSEVASRPPSRNHISAASAADRSAAGGLTASAQWRMLAVLTLFGMLASIDKNFLTLLVGSIRADLNVSDVQIGLVIGLAFAMSNVAASIPAGWMADRLDRRRVIGGSVALWSVMAMSCGLASSYGALFLARIGVGLGEGLSPPSSYALIRDGVPESRRGRAYGLFSIGATVGAGLAYVVGGSVLRLVSEADIKTLPLIGDVHPWQASLVIIGLAGLPLGLLAFTFPDPGRGAGTTEQSESYKTTIAAMVKHRRVLLPLAIYSVALAMLTNGWSAWAPATIQRTYGLTPQQIGPVLGLLLMIGAPLGLIGGGVLIDRLRDGIGLVAVGSAIFMAICLATVTQSPTISLFWLPQTIITLGSTMYLPVTSTLVAMTMPARMVGKAMAIFLLLQGALGTGLGPIVIAWTSEHLFGGGAHALNNGVTFCAIVLGFTATLGALGLLRRGKTAVPF